MSNMYFNIEVWSSGKSIWAKDKVFVVMSIWMVADSIGITKMSQGVMYSEREGEVGIQEYNT